MEGCTEQYRAEAWVLALYLALSHWERVSEGKPDSANHRRKMETEAKTKVVASVWGAKFIPFLAALAVLPRSIWKNGMNSTFSFKSTEAKQLARQGFELILPPKQKWGPLSLLLSPSFLYGANPYTHNWRIAKSAKQKQCEFMRLSCSVFVHLEPPKTVTCPYTRLYPYPLKHTYTTQALTATQCWGIQR